jgi:hypothetical protein
MRGGSEWRCTMVRVYTDYALPYEERQKAIWGWFASESDYEDFLRQNPDCDPKDYLPEAGAFVSRFLEDGVWYLPRRVALSIASIIMLEAKGWLPPGSFRQELLRELEDAEELEGIPAPGEFRLIYSSDDEEEEE